jgi:hypothetical protein
MGFQFAPPFFIRRSLPDVKRMDALMPVLIPAVILPASLSFQLAILPQVPHLE